VLIFQWVVNGLGIKLKSLIKNGGLNENETAVFDGGNLGFILNRYPTI